MLSTILSVAAFAMTEGEAEKYVQCYDGTIYILPALPKDEIPAGKVEGVPAVGGFVFDIEWKENKPSIMRIHSTKGGFCRFHSLEAFGSPRLHKPPSQTCPNAEIEATKGRRPRPSTPQNCFTRADRPLGGMDYEFETKRGEVFEIRGLTALGSWVRVAHNFPEDDLVTDEAARIAQNVLDYQLETGGWPKNYPMHDVISPEEREILLAQKSDRKRGTIDNVATFTEMRFLARMARATKRKKYLEGLVRGIDFLIYLQYPNGGWPQFDPAKQGYWSQITLNDGAMINAMEMLREIYEARPPFDVPIAKEKRQAAREAFDRGVACLLKMQIRQDGQPTLWCQQHDKDTLEPCIGRAFELPSICTLESYDVVKLLMSLDPLDYVDKNKVVTFAEIKAAIDGAKDWYAKTAIRGYKIEDNWRRPDGMLARRLVKIPEEESKPMWCRYYTLKDNRPFTGTRQSTMNFDFSEMEQGENMNYMWFNGCGEAMARDYPNWLERVKKRIREARLVKAGTTTRWLGGRGNGGIKSIESNKDTWENPANWTKGVPGEFDTAVFDRDATIWSLQRGAVPCGRIAILKNATLTLRCNDEANGYFKPGLRPLKIAGAGKIVLCGFGLEAGEEATLTIPETISLVSAGAAGAGAWLGTKERGRLMVEGPVSCPGNALRVKPGVQFMGDVADKEKFVFEKGATRPPPTLKEAAALMRRLEQK